MTKTYRGRRSDSDGFDLYVNVDPGKPGEGYELPQRQDVRNHSPTGFEWGYGGSGPAQLALAIVLDHLGNPEDTTEAQRLYMPFKHKVVARLERSAWDLTTDQVEAALQEIRATLPPRDVEASDG